MSSTKKEKEKENSPVNVFQKRMQQSAVPPLEANKPCWCGDHAIALTAAEWSVKRVIDEVDDTFQINFAFVGRVNNLAEALPTGDKNDLSLSRSWKRKEEIE